MKIIAWEITRKCELSCKHCRASAINKNYDGEFTTEEAFKTIDSIASKYPTLLILTGGEPMMRNDIREIIRHASSKKIRVVMATCGINLNSESLKSLRDDGLSRISLSLDGCNAKTHDLFRGRNGAFFEIVNCAESAKSAGLDFQINTTVTTENVRVISQINDIANELGAVVHDLFLLVPTGKASILKNIELDSIQYEQTLKWIAEEVVTGNRKMRVTCAPQYARVFRQTCKKYKMENSFDRQLVPNGCLAGNGFIFISHTGYLQPCGFLDVSSGNIRDFNYDFYETVENSSLFKNISKRETYLGKCGVCDYWDVCKGCRSRALAHYGNCMEDEPFCNYRERCFV